MDSIVTSYEGLLEGIDRCRRWAGDAAVCARRAPAVSEWSVAEHLEHLLLADRGILRWILGLDDGDPGDSRERPNEIGLAVLAAGAIPRGQGPAPEFALPAGMSPDEIASGLDALRMRAVGLERRLTALAVHRSTLPHHVLGHLGAAEWMRFLHIHHEHHAAIVRDILGAGPPEST